MNEKVVPCISNKRQCVVVNGYNNSGVTCREDMNRREVIISTYVASVLQVRKRVVRGKAGECHVYEEPVCVQY